MAELENGYTRIANGILEALAKQPLNGTQRRILDVIFRYTYGYNRKEHEMSLSFISTATMCDKRQIQRELKVLEMKKIIFQKIGEKRTISFNKNCEQWNGESANGKNTIGEITNGKLPNISVGESTNDTIGESTNQQKKTIKKTLNKYTAEFEKFYSEYPRPEDKNRSFTNWKTQLKYYTVEQLMAACGNYKKTKAGTDRQYLKSSANFLGKEKPFEDFLQAQPETVQKSRYRDMTNYIPGGE